MRVPRSSTLLLGTVVCAIACTSTNTGTPSGTGATPSTGGAASSSSGSAHGTGGGVNFTVSSSGTGATTVCVVKDMTVDMDHDGWTPAQGDCNDCDPNVNPGAVDVAGDPNMVDSNCDGKYDPPSPCDTGLLLDDVDPKDGAKAIDLCQFTTETPAAPQEKVWGVISAAYVRADGTPFPAPGAQIGIQNAWGPHVHVQGGANMLAMSSGYARTSSQAGACGSNSCTINAIGNPPPNFPQNNPACPPSSKIADDVGLELKIRAPTNATGFKFAFKFYSMEYPHWVCDLYNDQFVAIVTPAPTGSINGNISFDAKNAPVSVNLGFFDVCDPSQSAQYAAACLLDTSGPCPKPPTPYCPSGTTQLLGTGFDLWDSGFGGAGATSWLASQAPITGGAEFTVRFTIWDTGDQSFDSTTLIDDFQWIANKGTVVVSTNPVDNPQ
jgi:hypothetical protein